MQEYTAFTDDKLMQLLAAGDGRAFTEIYNRYWQTLFGVAYNRLQQVAAAEIAAALQISSKTVENQLNKALRHLKASLRNALSGFFSFLV